MPIDISIYSLLEYSYFGGAIIRNSEKQVSIDRYKLLITKQVLGPMNESTRVTVYTYSTYA